MKFEIGEVVIYAKYPHCDVSEGESISERLLNDLSLGDEVRVIGLKNNSVRERGRVYCYEIETASGAKWSCDTYQLRKRRPPEQPAEQPAEQEFQKDLRQWLKQGQPA